MTVVLAAGDFLLDGGFRRGLPAVRIRPGTTVDPHSKLPEADWTTATEATLTRVAIAPVSSDDVDSTNGRWVLSTMALYSLNYDIDVQPGDRVRFRSVTYEVTGEGGRWYNPYSGRKAGAVFGLKAIT